MDTEASFIYFKYDSVANIKCSWRKVFQREYKDKETNYVFCCFFPDAIDKLEEILTTINVQRDTTCFIEDQVRNPNFIFRCISTSGNMNVEIPMNR